MKLLSVLKDKLQKIFSRVMLRRLATVLLIVLLAQTVLFVFAYRAALEHLQRNDPRQLQNRSEIGFYFAPLSLRVGASMKRDDVIAYLRDLGYEERSDNSPASFSFANDSLVFRPRSVNFQSATITFARNHVSRIVVNDKDREQVELEPLQMQNFVRYLNDESLKEQRVRRTVLTAGQVSATLSDAVTSAEDCRFFSHHGVDVFGVARRVATRSGGGSSITQQLIKNTIFKGAKEEFWQRYLFFLPDSWQRKMTDIFFALAAEKLMSKDEILATYLSVVPLGAADGVELHGAEAAAQEFFGKPSAELSMAETATLAGMIHKPSFYLTKARQGDYGDLYKRRNHILDLVLRNHPEKYSADTIEKAKAEQPQFVFTSKQRTAQRPAEIYSKQFVELAAKNLPQELAQLQTSEGSSQIFTTLDFNLQKEGTQITEAAAQKLQTKIARVCQQKDPTKKLIAQSLNYKSR